MLTMYLDAAKRRLKIFAEEVTASSIESVSQVTDAAAAARRAKLQTASFRAFMTHVSETAIFAWRRVLSLNTSTNGQHPQAEVRNVHLPKNAKERLYTSCQAHRPGLLSIDQPGTVNFRRWKDTSLPTPAPHTKPRYTHRIKQQGCCCSRELLSMKHELRAALAAGFVCWSGVAFLCPTRHTSKGGACSAAALGSGLPYPLNNLDLPWYRRFAVRMPPSCDERHHPSAKRNRAFISAEIVKWLGQESRDQGQHLLEVASGTGCHAEEFAKQLSACTIQPTEVSPPTG